MASSDHDLVTAAGDGAIALNGARSDYDALLDRIGDARFVLLGEASHGTHDYYAWRAEISKRLIQDRGFSFIAVEGDWPDCYRVNRYVKGHGEAGIDAHEVLHAFDRWPTFTMPASAMSVWRASPMCVLCSHTIAFARGPW